ncbi:hypothetical protein CRG98_047821, partial [Punica granatum]
MSSSESAEAPAVSKKAAKKEAAKAEKLRRRMEEASISISAAAQAAEQENDPLSANYGDAPLSELQSKSEVDFPYTEVGSLAEHLKDQVVLVRGRAQTIRAVGKKMAFLVVRERGFTVQVVVTEQADVVSRQMVKYVAALNRESIIDVEGIVSVPAEPIKGASQKVEIQVRKLYCISRAVPTLPINLEDAARSEAEIQRALE